MRDYFGNKKLKTTAAIVSLIMCLTIFLPILRMVVLADSVTGTMQMSDKTYACNISDGRGMNAKYIQQGDTFTPVYCIEQGKRINSGDTMTRAKIDNDELGIAYICGYNRFNGWGVNDSTSLISSPSVNNGNFVKYAATQIVIWEIAEGTGRHSLTSGNADIQAAIEELYGRIDSYTKYVNNLPSTKTDDNGSVKGISVRENRDDALKYVYPATANDGVNQALLEDFIVNLYKGFLGREATMEDKQLYCDKITSGTLTAQQLLEALYYSQEAENYRTNASIDWSTKINGYYLGFMGRNGRADEIQSWLNEINNGKQWSDLYTGFNNSTEWSNRKGTLDVMGEVVFHYNYNYSTAYNPGNASFSRGYVNRNSIDFTMKGMETVVLSWNIGSNVAGNGILDTVYKWYDGSDEKQQATISATIKNVTYYAAFNGSASVVVPPTPTNTSTPTPTPTSPAKEDCYVSFELKKIDPDGNNLRGATFGIYSNAACTQVASDNNKTITFDYRNNQYNTDPIIIKTQYDPTVNTSISRTLWFKETKAPNEVYVNGKWVACSCELDTNVYRIELTYYPNKTGGNGKLEYKIYRTSDNTLMNPGIDANTYFGYDPRGYSPVAISNLYNLGLDNNNKNDDYGFVNYRSSFSLDKAITNAPAGQTNSLSGFNFQLLTSSGVSVATGTTNANGKTIWTTNYPTNSDKTVIFGLPYGTYNLRETMPKDRTFYFKNVNTTIPYTFKINDNSWSEVSSGTWQRQITIDKNNLTNAYASLKSVTNSYEHCDLSINKTINSVNELNADQTFTFNVYYRGNGTNAAARNDNQKMTVTVTVPKGQKSATVNVNDLPVGWYEVVEQEVPGYLVNYETNTLVRITNGNSFTFKVSNSVPTIETTLNDNVTKDHIIAQRTNITLVDTVEYFNLVPGKEYTVTGTLMNQETGEKLLDENGKEITSTKTFTPTKANDKVDIEFTFNSVILENKITLVAFEDLYFEGVKVATHSDITDENQTVRYPNIHTTFIDSTTNDKFVNISEEETLIDTVTYENLIVGQTYTVTGTLMVKETNEALKDLDGNVVTASTTFTVTKADDSVNVVFTIDTTNDNVKGKTLVAFETLYFGTNVIRTHEDINDVEQTVYVPNFKTTLLDKATDEHVVAENGTVTLVDTVTYSNLVVGKEYEMVGTLMNKDTGVAIKDADGNVITSTTPFTPNEPNGTVDVVFTFDGALLGNKVTIVAFEDLKYEGLTYATHTDINDESQTVKFPDVATSFIDEATNNQLVSRNTAATLVDTFTYENLTVGLTYSVTGTIMVKETGEALKDANGNVVTTTVPLTPTEENGSIQVKFTVDTTNLSGKTLVAFEVLTLNGKIIKSHEDINDVYQTIYVPDFKTTLTDKETNSDVATYSESTTLIDTVIYTNLVPGKEYILTGTLMDKNTNKPVLDENNKEITSTTKFTPTEPNGSEKVVFIVNATLLTGKTVVAFEKVTHEGIEVGIHADINDKDQTVIFPEIHTTFIDKVTNNQLVHKAELVTLVDTVTYSNLVPDMEYVVTGTLMNKATGKAYTNSIGEEVTATIKFTPREYNGTVDVTFYINTENISDVTLVAFEEITLNGSIVASHKDINDVYQTIYVPDFKTTLMDKATGTKTVAYGEEVTLVDTINYTNLVVGKEYTVTGTLMVKETEEPLKDAEGNVVTATKTFTATSKNGSIEVEFTIDSTLIPGVSLVAFEEVFYDGLSVGVHADIDDVSQTVNVPNIRTRAYEQGLNSNHIQSVENVIITDKVSYTNLTVGKEYTITGTLHYKDSSEAVLDAQGNPITAGVTFVAETSEGTVDVKFTVNGDLLKGKTIVAFENVYYEDILVGIHADITDESQTVYFPEISTKASVSGKSTFNISDKIELTDVISYKNLEPGVTYVCFGKLMNDDGSAFKVNGEEITSEIKFVPTTTDGEVTVTFTFDARNMKNNQRIVCFEILYAEGLAEDGVTVNRVLITSHEDVNDANQTVKVSIPSITTRTGEAINVVRIGEAICLFGIAGCLVLISKKKREEETN